MRETGLEAFDTTVQKSKTLLNQIRRNGLGGVMQIIYRYSSCVSTVVGEIRICF